MFSWGFCKDKRAGEELRQSFLTQYLNFPFLPLWYFTLWGFWQPVRCEDFKWACSVRTRAEGHFKVHSDNAFSVPPKTLSIFSRFHSLLELRSCCRFFTLMVLSNGFRALRQCPLTKSPKSHGWPCRGRRLTNSNELQKTLSGCSF